MYSSFSKLPAEVLAMIFTQLNKYDLIQCQLTCKNWKRSAQEELYKNVVSLFTKPNNEAKIDTFFNSLNKYSDLGKRVKEISLGYLFTNVYYQEEMREEILENLVKLCPNVKKIISVYDIYDAGRIAFWKFLMNERNQGYWKLITNAPGPRYLDFSYYVRATSSYSSSLTVLFLLCLSAKYDDSSDARVKNHLLQLEKLVTNLKSFNNLKKLIIDECEDYTRKRNIFRFEHVIDECPPSLEKLSLTSICSIDRELGMIALSNTTTTHDTTNAGLLLPRSNNR